MSLKKSPAWKHYSKYIKKKYGGFNSETKGRCYTCGKIAEGKFFHCGHFVQAFGHQNTFFEENNTRPQCYRCNINLYGNASAFAQHLIEDFGPGIIKELNDKGTIYKQWTKKELKEIAKKYKDLTSTK